MRSVYLGLIIRIFRKVKVTFGLCFIFGAAFILHGYFKQKEHDSSVIELENVQLEDSINRRHNRNLQHLYSHEFLNDYERGLEVKTNYDTTQVIPVFTNRDSPSVNNLLSEKKNKVKAEGHVASDYTQLNPLQKQNASVRKRLPNAIIIGVKKGGTRALLEFLRAHPYVKATGPEPHFFDKNYEKGLEWYRDLMPMSKPFQLTIEKTPGYFITNHVPNRIYNMSPNVKLVIVVRDPVTRAISDFAQIASKSSKHQSLESTLFKNNGTTVDITKTIIKVGMYSKHLERWLKYFPMDTFHIVDGENLVADPGTEISKLQDFLNLPILITHKHFYFNQSRGFPCIRKRLGKKPHCLDESKGRKHPYINPKSIQVLREFYRPYNLKFSRQVGQDFGWT